MDDYKRYKSPWRCNTVSSFDMVAQVKFRREGLGVATCAKLFSGKEELLREEKGSRTRSHSELHLKNAVAQWR